MKMKMNCMEAQAELPLFVGGDLESPGRERVAEHLESCEDCSVALARAAEARAALTEQLELTASSPVASAWPDLRERLLSEGLLVGATASASTPLTTAPVTAPRGRLLQFVSATAAAAGLLLLGSVAGRWYAQSSSVGDAGPSNAVPSIDSNALVEVSQPASGTNANGSESLLPVNNSRGLHEVENGESFAADSRIFYGERIQPFNAFASDGLRTVSYPGQHAPVSPASDRSIR